MQKTAMGATVAILAVEVAVWGRITNSPPPRSINGIANAMVMDNAEGPSQAQRVHLFIKGPPNRHSIDPAMVGNFGTG